MPEAQFNKYFVHRLNNGSLLLITELGRITPLTQSEFSKIGTGQISKPLLEKLEQGQIIVTDKNMGAIAQDYKIRYQHALESVSLHIINPTMRCNQQCLYCYANSQPMSASSHDMDQATAKKVVDFIWQSPPKNITIEFQGGEPLANFPAIEHIVNYAKSKTGKNVHWRIVTNLTMMDETIASFLKKNGILDLCTSLDGPKEVHDKNRPFSGDSSYSKVAHWINSLRQDFGFNDIGTLCTVTKNSLPFAEEIIQTYQSLELPDLTLVPIRKIGLAKENWGKIGFSPGQYLDFWKQAVDKCISLTKQGKPISEQIAVLSLSKINRFEPSYHTCFSKPCGFALMQCSYQPDGTISGCDEAKAMPLFKIGNVNQAFKQVFTSPEALNIVSISSGLGLPCNECSFTGFCRACPALSLATQGSLTPKLALDEDCQTKKEQFTFLLEKLYGEDRPVLEKWLSQKD
jgi:His-Xaa-Ser system radical SAM maturase HxsB